MLKDWRVASVVPSSRYVVERLLEKVNFEQARLIVEYGPGGGVLTRELLRHMRPETQLVAIERNELFVKDLQKIADSRLRVLHGDVLEMEQKLLNHGIAGPADVIFSSIPLTLFKDSTKESILERTSELLKTGGRFVAYQNTSLLEKFLKRYFHQVRLEFEPRNLPPQFIFECVK